MSELFKVFAAHTPDGAPVNRFAASNSRLSWTVEMPLLCGLTVSIRLPVPSSSESNIQILPSDGGIQLLLLRIHNSAPVTTPEESLRVAIGGSRRDF